MARMIDELPRFVLMDTKFALFCAVVYADLLKNGAASIS